MQVFSKDWFQVHQAKLLRFANSKIGRWILCINGDQSSVGDSKIVRIDPNAITWVNKKSKRKAYLTTEFRTNDKFARRLFYAFKPVWYLLHFLDWLVFDRVNPAYGFGFATLTQYPGSIGVDNPCDGFMRRSGVDETFATIIAGAGNATFNTDILVRLFANAVSNHYQNVTRSIFCFDTSALTSAATISAAVASLYGNTKVSGLGSPTVDIVASTPASTTALASTDYSQVASVSFANIAWASLSTVGYNDWTLDANGRANISKTGVSKFGLKTSWDIAGVMGGSWVANQDLQFIAYAATAAGTTTDPKLVVTYTVPLVAASGAASPFYFLS